MSLGPKRVERLRKKLYEKAKRDKRHKVQTRGARQYSWKEVYGHLGVVNLYELYCTRRRTANALS